MAKMTKTQKKNLLQQIKSKAFKLLGEYDVISVADYMAISKIIARAHNKLK